MIHDIPNSKPSPVPQEYEDPAANEFETSLIKLMYCVDAGEEIHEFPITELRTSDSSDTEPASAEDEAIAKHRINELCEALGIDASKWTQVLIESTFEQNGYLSALTTQDTISIDLEQQTAGNFLVKEAYESLPVESGEDGEGRVTICLAVGSSHILNLYADGEVCFDWGDEDAASEMSMKIGFTADVVKKPAQEAI